MCNNWCPVIVKRGAEIYHEIGQRIKCQRNSDALLTEYFRWIIVEDLQIVTTWLDIVNKNWRQNTTRREIGNFKQKYPHDLSRFSCEFSNKTRGTVGANLFVDKLILGDIHWQIEKINQRETCCMGIFFGGEFSCDADWNSIADHLPGAYTVIVFHSTTN